MLRDRILNVISQFPRSTALIKFDVSKDGGDHVTCDQIRKELRTMEKERIVRSTPYPYHKGQIEWRLNELRGE